MMDQIKHTGKDPRTAEEKLADAKRDKLAA